MRSGRQWQRTMWLGGLLLVLVLLGHDGLMASVAHAAPAQPAIVTHHAHSHQRPATVATAITSEGDHQPGHPSTCGVAGTAVPASGHQLDLADLGDAGRITNDLSVIAQPWIGCWDEPFWPPGTRRALLQIYRI